MRGFLLIGEHLIFCIPSAISEETPCVGGVLYVGKCQILEQIQTGVQKNQMLPQTFALGDAARSWLTNLRLGRYGLADS